MGMTDDDDTVYCDVQMPPAQEPELLQLVSTLSLASQPASQPNEITGDLFAAPPPVSTEKLVGMLDAVNGRWGRGTMRLARCAAGYDESELYHTR